MTRLHGPSFFFYPIRAGLFPQTNTRGLTRRLGMQSLFHTEMAVIAYELGRVVRAGGRVFMVNDNVRYHGEEVPIDLILSDFAEQCGFHCAAIWMLKRGKGNSSQQMGCFGRREIRKCVYEWVKVDE